MLTEALLGVLITVHSVVLQVLALAPLVAIALSSSRLRANNYGNVGNDAAKCQFSKAQGIPADFLLSHPGSEQCLLLVEDDAHFGEALCFYCEQEVQIWGVGHRLGVGIP